MATKRDFVVSYGLQADKSTGATDTFVVDYLNDTVSIGNLSFSGSTLTGSLNHIGTSITTRAATTQDGVSLVGRAGGTGSFKVSISPTTLTADRTLTLANGDTTLQAGTMATTGGTLAQFAATTSLELLGVISDETGTGSLVFANTPTLTTPVLGVATATSITASSTNITIASAAGNNNVVLSPTGTGYVDVSNKRITNVAVPVLLSDAVNKEYADSIASSLNIHGAVQAATTTSVSYSYTGGGTALTITTIASNVITFSANHGLKINSQILANATSNGLTSGTTYYVISIPNLNQVTISTTLGGTTHTLTDGTGLTISVTGDQGVGATLSGTPTTVDGYTLVLNDSVLVKNHTTGAYNGAYTVTTVGTGSNGVWTRRTDSDNSPTGELNAGDYFFVSNGTTNANTSWTQTTQGPIIVGTTSIAYTQFGAAGNIIGGAGLTKTGDTLDVVGTADRITVNADSVDIASTYAGQSSITTLGTIGSGTWQGSVIATTYGGTGTSTSTGTGSVVLSNTPTLVTPVLGAATGTSLNLSGTASSTLNLSGLYTTPQANATNNSNAGFVLVGPTLTFNDTDKLATFVGDVNSYAQLIVQNKNSGSSASADVIVNNDRVGGTSIYGDFGINSTGWTGGGTFGDLDGTYLYAAGGTLTVGTIGTFDFKIGTNNTTRITVTSAGNTTILGNTTLTLANALTPSTGLTLSTGTTYDASAARTLTVSSNTRTRTINFIIDGGGALITTGVKGDVVVDFDATIIGWIILGDVAGTITVDVSKASYANFPTFTASGGTSASITSPNQKNTSAINWTNFTTIAVNDVLRFTVSGTVSSVTRVTLAIDVVCSS